MNGYPLSSSFIGALGEYPLSQILNLDNNLDTILSSSQETHFSNNNQCKTKIDNNGILTVYYTSNILAPTIPTQWLDVEDSLSYFYNQDAANQLQTT